MTDHTRLDRHLDPSAAGSPVRLLPGLATSPGVVAVVIGDNDATTRRGQLLAWATINMLLRCYGVMDTVVIHCPDAALTTDLPRLQANAAPATLHQALADLATACADPQDRRPRLRIQPRPPAQFASPGTVTLVLGTDYADRLAHTAGSHADGVTWQLSADAWKLNIATPAALASIDTARLPRLDEDGSVSVAAWMAAALGCAEAFKNIGRLKKGHGRQIEAFSVNLWRLTGSDGFAELDTLGGPTEPLSLPAHYVIGAGAVSQAYLAVLATSDVSTELALLDHDKLSDTNLNRHILAGWSDLTAYKATLAEERLSGHRLRVFPVKARWQNYLATPPTERDERPETLATAESTGCYDLVISAVDRNDSRVSIAKAHPQVILSGSTNGLAVEVGRYRAESNWQCLACASRPEPQLSIEEAAKELASKTRAEVAMLARERGLDLKALLDYIDRPVCGTLGAREMERFAKFTQPDWSVSFASVASGALLAARVLTHVVGQSTEPMESEGDTLRLWLINAAIGCTAHQRNPDCPVCGPSTR